MTGQKYSQTDSIGRITRVAVIVLVVSVSAVTMVAFVNPSTHSSAATASNELTRIVRLMAPEDDSGVVNVAFQQIDAPPEDNDSGTQSSQEYVTPPGRLAAENVSGEFPSTVQLRTISLSQIDAVITHGNYSFAADLLNDFEPHASGLLKSKIRLRQGLCAELLGDAKTAFSHYRALARSIHSGAAADAATIAAARVLLDRGQGDAGNAMLLTLLLSRERSMHDDLVGDVVHLLARGLAVPAAEDYQLDDQSWLNAEHAQRPEELLQRWTLLTPDETTPFPHEGLRIRRLNDSPEGVLISLQFRSLTAADLLRRIFAELDWSVEGLETASRILYQRAVELNCDELPLDVVLDALLTPSELTWSFVDGVVRIEMRQKTVPERSADQESQLSEGADESLSRSQLKTALRFQRLAVNLAPDHPRSAVSYVLQGTTAARLGEIEQAVGLLQSTVELFPRSPARGVATFNLGKAALIQGDRQNALKYFYATVDNASGVEADTLAYLYIGRILLENDVPEHAIGPLMRGLALAEETKYEAAAALLLAEAWLLKGNANGANTVLLDHRAAFELNENTAQVSSARKRNQKQRAALISNLARFWGSTGSQRIREGRAVLTALTNPGSHIEFGGQSVYLTGVAFAAVGLDSERDAVFQKCLSGKQKYPLQQRMIALLEGNQTIEESVASGGRNHGDSPSADSASGSSPVESDGHKSRSVLIQAEAAYRNGNYEAVLTSCHTFLQATSETQQEREFRRPILRLMGLAYQAQGRHADAVRCFAGISTAADSETISRDNRP